MNYIEKLLSARSPHSKLRFARFLFFFFFSASSLTVANCISTRSFAQEESAVSSATDAREGFISIYDSNNPRISTQARKNLVVSTADQTDGPAQEAEKSSEKEIDVLIDMRHAYDFSDYPLTVDDHFYHRIYSFHRAFSYLKTRGVHVEKYESETPIDADVLSKCQTLFLNLPSGDKEPFLLSELIAIRDFIQDGGSAFFIVDHTNCYFHQSRLQPLFHELDIEPQFYGICDMTQKLGDGYGWIYMNKFSESPITQNLRQIAFQTGGGVDPRFAVVWSSEKSWQDKAGIPVYGEADLSYFGNFHQDAGEYVGSSGGVLAKSFGKGRIIVVGDQNLFSTFFFQYLDNYRLWNNAFAWLLSKPELADPQAYVETIRNESLFICWEELHPTAKRFGNPDATGYYNLYANLCRYYNPFCIANDDSAIGLTSDAGLIIGCGIDASDQGIAFCCKQLERGKTLIVLDPDEDAFVNQETGLSKTLYYLKQNGISLKTQIPQQSSGSNAHKNNAERVELSNGGVIVALRGRDSFSNASVPAPEKKLLLTQQENLKSLFREIDAVLSPTPTKNSSDASNESPKPTR